MIKVRIDKAEPHQWYYKEFIGENLNVKEHEDNLFYRFTDKKTIRKSDCTVISEDTEQEEKKFVLPEKWCVSHCKESLAWIKKNGENNASNIRENKYYYMPCDENKDNSSGNKPISYTEITQDQFFAHVWEKEFKKEEPKVINVSKETAEKVKDIFESNQLKPVTPVPVVQETTEPIPFNLENYNTGKYNVVTRSNDNVKIISTTEELDQPIIGIHDKTVEKWSIDGNYCIRSKENDLDLFLVAKIETEDNYVSIVEEEHEEKINNTEVACSIAGFNLKRKDLDMFVSMYDLVIEYGGKLDLDTITETQVKVNRRHDSAV